MNGHVKGLVKPSIVKSLNQEKQNGKQNLGMFAVQENCTALFFF